MIQLLFYFFDLLSFKGSPSDAPYSPPLLAALILIDISLEAIGNYGFGSANAVVGALISPALLTAGVAGILALRNTSARLLQTLTAYFGAVVPLNLLSLGLALGYQTFNAPKAGSVAAFFGLSLVCMLLWHTALLVHILRASANWLAVQALPAAIALTIFVTVGVQLLMPNAG
jgi:hypothetical protein